MKLKWTLLLGALLPFALSAMEIEAETGTVSGKTEVFANAEASGGKTVYFRTETRSIPKPTPADTPSLVLKAKLEKDANYQISAVVYTPNTSSDSVYMAVDDEKLTDRHFGFPKKGVKMKLVQCKLTAGEHLIKFWAREPNLQIDKIVIEEVK